MISPEEVKQIFDVAGYSLMGLVGMFSAWRRVNSVMPNSGPPLPLGRRKGGKGTMSAMERLSKVEQDLVMLRNRQDEMHQENAMQQSSMLNQQTAMFDLLVQQRATLDKILAKMIGIV